MAMADSSIMMAAEMTLRERNLLRGIVVTKREGQEVKQNQGKGLLSYYMNSCDEPSFLFIVMASYTGWDRKRQRNR